MSPGTFEDDEGTLINLHSGDLAAAPGWTILEGTVNRIGPEEMIHLELAFGAAAAALVLTLPPEFWPPADVHTADGKFVVHAADGTITYTGSTVSANAGPVVCEIVYDSSRGG